jgi:predicted DNA-binding transcriptional regulator AlpA
MKNQVVRKFRNWSLSMNADKKSESIRSFLSALGYEPEVIEAGINALGGRSPTVTVNPEEPLMSPKQLAKRLSISTVTLWRMSPPFVRVGRRKRFIWSEIQEFLKATGKKVAA